MNNQLNIKIKFVTTYKPLFFKSKQKKIYCKYFFFIYLFLEYYFFKLFSSKGLSFLKKTCKLNNVLRSPNRYKKSQLALKIIKYFIILILQLNFNFLFSNIIFLRSLFLKCLFFNSNFFHIASFKYIFIVKKYKLLILFCCICILMILISYFHCF